MHSKKNLTVLGQLCKRLVVFDFVLLVHVCMHSHAHRNRFASFLQKQSRGKDKEARKGRHGRKKERSVRQREPTNTLYSQCLFEWCGCRVLCGFCVVCFLSLFLFCMSYLSIEPLDLGGGVPNRSNTKYMFACSCANYGFAGYPRYLGRWEDTGLDWHTHSLSC